MCSMQSVVIFSPASMRLRHEGESFERFRRRATHFSPRPVSAAISAWLMPSAMRLPTSVDSSSGSASLRCKFSMNVMRRACASSMPVKTSHGTVSSPATVAALTRRCPAMTMYFCVITSPGMTTIGSMMPTVAIDAARSATDSGVISPRGFHGAGTSCLGSMSRRTR